MEESGVGVGDLKIEESESEVLCTDSTGLDYKAGCAPEQALGFWIRKISWPRRESNPNFPVQFLA
jgi:hypothetical protein